MEENQTITVVEIEDKKPEVNEYKQEVQQVINARSDYLNKGVTRDFGDYDFFQKLAVCQIIEKKFIKRRKIGNNMIPYLPHPVAEKILNFLFNFKVSNRVLEIHSVEKMTKTSYKDKDDEWKQKDSKSYDAWALVEFSFTYPDGYVSTRTVVGTHRSFDNIATSEHEAKKAAVSKSWVVVARTFNIGVEIGEKEEASSDRAFKKEFKKPYNNNSRSVQY